MYYYTYMNVRLVNHGDAMPSQLFLDFCVKIKTYREKVTSCYWKRQFW